MKRSRLNSTSRKRRKEAKQYTDLRRRFLQAHPICQCADCSRVATQVHHRKGRGKYFLAVGTWLAVCADCHEEIERNPKWAKNMGYSINRASNNPILPPGDNS